jgi:hypothetical protein
MSILKKFTSIATVAACVVGSVMFGGCGSKPKMQKFDVTVINSSTQPVAVDLVAVPKTEVDTWKSYNVDEYFGGNDVRRANNSQYIRKFEFNAPGGQEKVATNDAIWKTWHPNRPMLLVLATSRNLRAQAGKAGENNVRVKEIELTNEYFEKPYAFTVTVTDSGISVNPPPVKKEK